MPFPVISEVESHTTESKINYDVFYLRIIEEMITLVQSCLVNLNCKITVHPSQHFCSYSKMCKISVDMKNINFKYLMLYILIQL